ncbi:YcgN family cysteine cluster protein [uncultured Thiodictyon sp.]|uniref:YcgN family cysteine cluster protein n=1 Tax=uncultured Thiodictyon sp. TaxID=1846217 RepID=UPI0025E2BD14|nr:YcgN family cysteine cluster protein [uncultured Thiodictyon sp.]
MSQDAPFWETTPLTQMTAEQWESLCDGCGKCCLEKFEAEDTGEIVYSRVACTLLDIDTCRCRDYPNRARQVLDCITLTMAELDPPKWLPTTCAYRRLTEGRPLPRWHPLITGNPESVAKAGQSVRGRVIGPETGEDPLMNLIDWIK